MKHNVKCECPKCTPKVSEPELTKEWFIDDEGTHYKAVSVFYMEKYDIWRVMAEYTYGGESVVSGTGGINVSVWNKRAKRFNSAL